MPVNNNKNAAANLERDERILDLALLKHSQRWIAKTVGCSQSTVRNVLQKAREARLHPKADELRDEQIERLNLYLKSLSSRILAGDDKALNTALRTEERIARLLGLDMPQQIAIQTHTRESDALEVQNMIRQHLGKGKE